MTREELLTLEPGDRVKVAYTGYNVEGDVVEIEPMSRYGPQRGWVKIRQTWDSNHGTEYAGATYEAAAEFVARIGDDLPVGPFVNLYATPSVTRSVGSDSVLKRRG